MMNTSPTFRPQDDESDASGPSLSVAGWIWVGLGLAALVATAAWFGWGQAAAPVRWQDVGFSIPSSTEATVTYDVYLYTDEPVVCYLEALNTSYGEVGVATQDVDPADGSEQRLTTAMSTVEEATTALVNFCAVR